MYVSSSVISSSPEVMLISMFFAPAMSLWFSRGDSSAMLATAIARSSPDARPEPISATPLLVITVCTSAKSTLTVFSRVMTSAMPLAAVARMSSALWNASVNVSLPKISCMFSLLISSNESTHSRNSSIP